MASERSRKSPRPPVARERFTAVVPKGHKGLGFEVPFSPETRWGVESTRLRPGRRGYAVRGTVNGVAFESFVFGRARRFFVLVTDGMQTRARLRDGSTVKVSLSPVV
jgi:Domain of unknown function (DUF1905)